MSIAERVRSMGAEYRTRDQWGASVHRWRWNSRSRATPIPMNLPASRRWVHHTVTRATADASRDMRTVETIGHNRFGRFSYSFAIHPSGLILEGCGEWIGAHTKGFNSTSLAAVAIGNYDTEHPSKAMIRSYGVLFAALEAEGWVTQGAPIDGHRNAAGASTACPGRYLMAALPDIRALADNPTPEPPTEEVDDMPAPILAKNTDDGRWYITDGFQKRYVRDRGEAKHLDLLGLARVDENGEAFAFDRKAFDLDRIPTVEP